MKYENHRETSKKSKLCRTARLSDPGERDQFTEGKNT